MTTLAIDTPHGRANAHLHRAEEPRGALLLGHGAGGGVTAGDLVAVTEVARSEAFTVVLVEQPYRVAGRRSPAPARQLDAAWTAVVGQLVAGALRGLPLVVGGRSLGARVACRTADTSGAVAVLCLAFPKEWRDALIGSEPDKFMMPSPSDLRYNWVLVRLASIDAIEMRELVLDAWAMVVPKSVAAAYAETDITRGEASCTR